MRHFILSFLVLGYVSVSLPVQAANIVRWVDQDGVTHFGNRAPTNQVGVEEVFVQPTNQADVPTSDLSESVANQVRASARNRSSGRRTSVVLEVPKRVIKPTARPSSKHRGRVL